MCKYDVSPNHDRPDYPKFYMFLINYLYEKYELRPNKDFCLFTGYVDNVILDGYHFLLLLRGKPIFIRDNTFISEDKLPLTGFSWECDCSFDKVCLCETDAAIWKAGGYIFEIDSQWSEIYTYLDEVLLELHINKK